jgi:uncharacterized protein (TIGR02246 family)
MKSQIFQVLMILMVLAISDFAATGDDISEFAFLEAYASAWNTHDGDVLAALFTTDADIMMGNLPLIVGRKAIRDWWQIYFSRIDEDRKGNFELLSTRVIAPGVKLVNILSKTSGTNVSGDQLETRLARGTWVVVKTGKTWLIAAMRGLPAEGEQRVRPGTDR